MDALTELRKVITAEPRIKTGKVISVSGGVVLVSIDGEVVEGKNTGSTQYKKGNTVRIQGGVVMAKIKSESSSRIYHI